MIAKLQTELVIVVALVFSLDLRIVRFLFFYFLTNFKKVTGKGRNIIFNSDTFAKSVFLVCSCELCSVWLGRHIFL